MTNKNLISYNIGYLSQALDLLESVEEAAYIECRPPYFTSSIGDHLRHIVEHYRCFLAGVPLRTVDYDARERDARIAGSPRLATAAVRALIESMSRLPVDDDAVRVRLDGSAESPEADPWSRSTLKRELQYLQAHTVHHYALIAFILRLQGTEPDAAFGVAPSTLRHRRQTASDRQAG